MAVRAGGNQPSHAVGFSGGPRRELAPALRASAGSFKLGRFGEFGAGDARWYPDQSLCRGRQFPAGGAVAGAFGSSSQASPSDGRPEGGRTGMPIGGAGAGPATTAGQT